MSKTEHKQTDQKACLSTSYPGPQVPTPPSSPEPEVETDAEHDGRGDGDDTPPPVPPKTGSGAPAHPPPKPDYVLALCYTLVYLEIAWLIYMVLHPHSRD